MAGTFVSPGVYVLERDFSDYAPALSTAIFGAVGGASWGPIDTLTLITNENALINTFGTPKVDDTVTPKKALYPGITAGIHYLRNGSTLQYIRVADGAEAAATIDLLDDGTQADFISTVDLVANVDLSTNKFVAIDINNAGPITIDLAGGTPAATTRAET